MDYEKINEKRENIDRSITWIEEKTIDIFNSFDLIKDCFSKKCQKKKNQLFNEFNLYLNKLKIEEDNITKIEKEFFLSGNPSGINE